MKSKIYRKHGFTLVELLVVIAILAILATVSVVGYTSFIERASLSNDENIAAQLNNFLLALKADHSSEHYGQEITPSNIQEITSKILADSGLGTLEPQSAKHGYDFYFDHTTDKYVVLKNSAAMTSGLSRFLAFFASAAGENVKTPLNCFTTSGNYSFMSTAGSDLATALAPFRMGEGATKAQLQDAINAAIELAKADKLPEELAKLLAGNATYVTPEGNLAYDGSELDAETKSDVVNNVFVLGGTKQFKVDASIEYKDGTTVNIVIPTGTTFISGMINVTSGADKVTITVNASSPKALESMVEIGFTHADVTINVSGDMTKDNSLIGGDKVTDDGSSQVVATLRFNNPVKDFHIEIDSDKATEWKAEDITDPTNAGADRVYIAEHYLKDDAGNWLPINFLGYGETGHDDTRGFISNPEPTHNKYKIEVVGVKVLGEELKTTGLDAYATAINNPNGGGYGLQLADTYPTSMDDDIEGNENDPVVEYILVKFTSRIDKNGNLEDVHSYVEADAATRLVEVRIAAIKSITFTLAGKTWDWEGKPIEIDATLISFGEGTTYELKNELSFVNSNLDQSLPPMEKAITVSYEENDLLTVTLPKKENEEEEEPAEPEVDPGTTQIITLAGGKSGTVQLKVNVGYFHVYTINVNVIDATESMTIKPKHDLEYIGNGDAIRLDEIFDGIEDIPEDSYIVIFSNSDIDDEITQAEWMTPSYSGMLTTTKLNETAVRVDETSENYNVPGLDSNGKLILKNAGKKIDNGGATTIKVAGESSADIAIAIFNNGVRISPDLKVKVINAENISKYTDFTKEYDNAYATAGDVVLLDDIVMTADSSNGFGRLFVKGHTVYGNYCELDITAAYFTNGNGYGLIQLQENSKIQDLSIIGKVFDKVELSATNAYGVSAVSAGKNTVIDNCYIANTRAPLNIDASGGTVTINNSVIFGGVYCNIDVRAGELKLTGKVVTMNMPYHTNSSSTKVVGIGITVWVKSDPTSYKINAGECTLEQYNFLSTSDATLLKDLPVDTGIKYIDTVNLSLGTIFGKLFTDTDYTKFLFGDGQCINSGMVALELSGQILGKEFKSYGGELSDSNTIIPHNGYSAAGYTHTVMNALVAKAELYMSVYSLLEDNETNAKLFANREAAFEKYNPDAPAFVGGSAIKTLD